MGALDGKVAVITGGSSGIGAATARLFRQEGARVAVGARRTERLEGDFRHELDVTDPDSCRQFVDAVVGELGGIDILFNAAGLSLGRDPFWDSTEDDDAQDLRSQEEEQKQKNGTVLLVSSPGVFLLRGKQSIDHVRTVKWRYRD